MENSSTQPCLEIFGHFSFFFPHRILVFQLPRAISRFSQQVGSLDDLPLSLPALSPNLNSERKTSQAESSAALQSYVERLAEDESTVFGATLKRFIECTVQSEEADPSVVVRNVRQFINGIKNYLVKHGEGMFCQSFYFSAFFLHEKMP
ncbi:unnamed protein product [Cylicostephanus goldi]|uniref:Uncharacterized protein n=1 Tax=Cylicostephanus goldi TaxID=71465 RepID=A0A3P6TNT6_CYLGO|nr:unnamed protein product [Cylicostephanus goldi]